MKEREFQSWVIDTAEALGWRVWHVAMPMRPIGGQRFVPEKRGRGLPDLVMMRESPPGLIFAEVKNETGTLSAEQREFLRLARIVGDAQPQAAPGWIGVPDIPTRRVVGAYSWRPGQEELIEATLR